MRGMDTNEKTRVAEASGHSEVRFPEEKLVLIAVAVLIGTAGVAWALCAYV